MASYLSCSFWTKHRISLSLPWILVRYSLGVIVMRVLSSPVVFISLPLVYATPSLSSAQSSCLFMSSIYFMSSYSCLSFLASRASGSSSCAAHFSIESIVLRIIASVSLYSIFRMLFKVSPFVSDIEGSFAMTEKN